MAIMYVHILKISAESLPYVSRATCSSDAEIAESEYYVTDDKLNERPFSQVPAKCIQSCWPHPDWLRNQRCILSHDYSSNVFVVNTVA